MFNIHLFQRPNSQDIELYLEISRRKLMDYVQFGEMMREISATIAKEMYPEIKGLILKDKTFKKRIINEVLTLLAGELSNEVKNKKDDKSNSK